MLSADTLQPTLLRLSVEAAVPAEGGTVVRRASRIGSREVVW